MITMRTYGPWDRFIAYPRRLSKELPKIAVKAINTEGQAITEALKNAMASGKAGGPGLSPITVAKKGHGTKLVDSGALAGSVSFDPVDVGKNGFVGIKEGVGHPTGISMTALMAIQEFGTGTIPARPIIVPFLTDAGPKMVQSVLKIWGKEAPGLW